MGIIPQAWPPQEQGQRGEGQDNRCHQQLSDSEHLSCVGCDMDSV